MDVIFSGQADRTRRWRVMLASAALVCALGVGVSPQVQLDVCGCKDNPATLGHFDTSNPATYPPGTTFPAINFMDIPLPPDGVMIFDSITLAERPAWVGYGLTVRFIPNAANTPVTLLVAGDFTMGLRTTISVSGDAGLHGSTNGLGKGGLGGPGGFRGGDGAYQLVNFGTFGGAGLGPGGGSGGIGDYVSGGHGAGATFLGAPDLLPLIGGSGGGGGASTATTPGCSGGGGGGGGGALLIAVNGTLTINGQAVIVADGGASGNFGSTCASAGGGGSGGAVRLLATTITGTGNVYARAGSASYSTVPAQTGAIRMEALTNNLVVGNTTPLATRAAGPGPIVNPITPTVTITSVGGQAIPQPAQGGLGNIDLVLPAPGQTEIGFSTSGVPTGTTVNVTVKPRVGSPPITTPLVTPVTLTNCDANGACLANVSFNLAAGAYFVEARATFQTP